MLYVFLDTTALHKAYRLRGSLWDSIQTAIERDVVVFATSTITMMELERQAAKDAIELQKSLTDLRKDVERHYVELPDMPIPFEAVAWREKMNLRLKDRHVEVLNRADPSHDVLLDRDFEDRFPFKPSGEGYRDTLIWLTFLDWLSNVKPTTDDKFFLVTGNSKQFAKDSKKGNALAPQLYEEVKAIARIEVELVETLENLVDKIRPFSLAATGTTREKFGPAAPKDSGTDEAMDEELEEAAAEIPAESNMREGEASAISTARAKAFGLDGEGIDFTAADPEFAGVNLQGPHQALAPLENGSIMNIELVEGRDEADLVDEFDETTQLWRVTVEVDVELEGVVHKSEYSSLSGEVTVLDGDWNAHYMWVSAPLRAALRFDVRVESGGDATAELVGATALSELGTSHQ